jgi:5-methylcytosine-specific restriction endonuclease McrA
MPISPERQKLYPSNWAAISLLTRQRAGWRCELCSARQRQPHPRTGGFVILMVHHINGDPRDNRRLNLIALCQRCHNRLDQPYRRTQRPAGWLFGPSESQKPKSRQDAPGTAGIMAMTKSPGAARIAPPARSWSRRASVVTPQKGGNR